VGCRRVVIRYQQGMHLERLELHAVGTVDLAAVEALFPTVAIARIGVPGVAAISDDAWRADELDFWAFDRSVDAICDRGEPLQVTARAERASAITREVLTRAQRRVHRRNRASRTPWFDRVLEEHRALHDLDKPLVRADLDHALDAWQWCLRLDPDANAVIQLATLLHDIERLLSEPDQRIEHRAASYQAFKDAHALAGARIASTVLDRAGVPLEIAASAATLVAVHERPSDEPALRAVNDADALSFFSLNSPGYVSYFGREQTAKKVSYTLARMSPGARAQLSAVRLPAVVRELLADHGHRA
jgi:hypothetical protein